MLSITISLASGEELTVSTEGDVIAVALSGDIEVELGAAGRALPPEKGSGSGPGSGSPSATVNNLLDKLLVDCVHEPPLFLNASLVRHLNRGLRKEGSLFVGELVQMSRYDVLQVHRIGEQRVADLELALARHGLSLSTDVGSWEPPDVPRTSRRALAERLVRPKGLSRKGVDDKVLDLQMMTVLDSDRPTVQTLIDNGKGLLGLTDGHVLRVGHVVSCSESEILRIRRIGRLRLNRIKTALYDLGVCLHLDVSDWTPPEDRA